MEIEHENNKIKKIIIKKEQTIGRLKHLHLIIIIPNITERRGKQEAKVKLCCNSRLSKAAKRKDTLRLTPLLLLPVINCHEGNQHYFSGHEE